MLKRTPKSPPHIVKNLLEVIEKSGGQVLRQDFYRVLGSSSAVRRWVDGCLLPEGLVREIKVKSKKKEQKAYVLTDLGKAWNYLLENWFDENVRLIRRLSGKRLKSKYV